MNYDIIGDIHGQAGKLRTLLQKLGYGERSGVWQHPDRTAIFVGDFIDRGPHQLETVNIVRRMVEGGHALAVMGNHEFNAIAWYLEDPVQEGEYLRPHSGEVGEKNRRQHAAFLAEAEGTREHREAIDWFLTLPLWLELPELRVVHACWHPRYMADLASVLRPGNRLDDALVAAASRKGTPEYRAVEALLKGIEIPLPRGSSFRDKDGVERHDARVRWWDSAAITYRQAALVPPGSDTHLTDDEIPREAQVGYANDKPVFFGHYWLTGNPQVQSPCVACIDYSAGKKAEPLVAYRFDGEPELDASKLVSSH
ncbi:Bis(5'-nucleosyl)-tetraphosphatase, symmetrical [Cupriavidus yeoncheonensis]|uniref:Bis(5'-nucleosyl)-tetraphosphatase, symmetrical n=1 Tax=Cupriavidus yeoncheonensis TaxID=1462994 RepID=A0A916IY01_9BURK|nr:metallophosphoesterase [Cupriavidus yeoncheonensis]CAG2155559.1 Bis(5'-nucleosyl)-tetraphosphatase, symmetrical [Cupriavidus yeoncheonensis]